MVWSYFNNLGQGQTETAYGTLRRRAEKSKRRTHLVRLCQLNLQTLVLAQQRALGFLRVHRTVVQLVVLKEDLDERRPGGDGALDQLLRQRIFDVLLQGTPQRTRAVAAVGQRLVQNPLLRLVGHGHRDRALRQILVQLVDHEFEDLDQVAFVQRVE